MRHTVALVTAAVLVLGPASAAHADGTTLGQAGPPVECNTAVPAGVLPGGGATATYTAATPGVITSFSTVANNIDGQVRAIVFGPGATTSQRTVVAKSPKVSVTRSVLNTFLTRLPVRAGDQLGLGYTVARMGCAITGAGTDRTWIQTGFDPDTNSTFELSAVIQDSSTPPRIAFRPNISAVVEPDADGDQFGDLTQDACPASGLTQAACPAPGTKITKRPKGKRANPKVKVKFTSDVAGSTFQCQLDGKKWYACTSPYKKKLKVGVHKIKIRAVSPFGVVDAKPAKVKVEITR